MNKLVVFDLDGVLVDACEWHRIALNQALREVCNYEINIDEHYSTFNGIPTKVKLQKLTEMGILRREQHVEVYDRKQELTIKTIEKYAEYRKEKGFLNRTDRDGNTLLWYAVVNMNLDMMNILILNGADVNK